jgi:hypothetical protein
MGKLKKTNDKTKLIVELIPHNAHQTRLAGPY